MKKRNITPNNDLDVEYNEYCKKCDCRVISAINKPLPKGICLRCMGQGYYEDSKGTARFCPDCLSKRGEEQHG